MVCIRRVLLVTIHLALYSLGWQAPNARHVGRYGPEGQLQWLVQSEFFWCCTSRCVARGVQENWICGIWRLFFYAPLNLEVTCSSFCLRSTGLLIFQEMTPGMVSVFITFLVQQRIHVRHQSTRPFWKNFTLSYVKGGLSDPEVDPRPHDCCKLRTLRSCSSSLSSTSLSLRTGRFPWSLRFSSCSTLTRWSTSVVQVSLHARCVHRQMPWSMSSRSSSTVADVAVMPQHLFQLSASTAGMMGRFFRALHTGAGRGGVSTGTRPP